jgi:hypothetical protein
VTPSIHATHTAGQTRRWSRQLPVIVLVLCLVATTALAGCSSASPSSPVTAPTVPVTGPSLSRLESYIRSSAAMAEAPNLSTTVPPLSGPALLDIALPMSYPCFSNKRIALPANPNKQCAWGNRSAKRTIFMFGDSQAAMWLPTLDRVGKQLGYKVVLLARVGCPPWQSDKYPGYLLSAHISVADCRAYLDQMVKFANATKPSAILPIGDSGQIGPDEFPTTADFTAEISALIASLAQSKSSVIFLSAFPQYQTTAKAPMTPTTCLSIHGNNVIPCLLTPSFVRGLPVSMGVAAAASELNLPLVNVFPLFCTRSVCPLFVRSPESTFLVHSDSYHMNRYYAAWIAPSFAQLIKPYL